MANFFHQINSTFLKKERKVTYANNVHVYKFDNIDSMQTESFTSIGRVVAYCTAASYKLKELIERLKESYPPTLFRDVVHFNLPDEAKDVFFFSYGAVVMWGLNEEEEQLFLSIVKEFEKEPQEVYERELMGYTNGSNVKISDEVVVLPGDEMLSRLAISHGLAQSVRLATFENGIQKTINKTKQIPEHLASQGKIHLSKKEIRKKMGELFLERSYVNLHFEILDVPEFFWEHSELEPLYRLIAAHLDLETRVEVLNKKLDIVHELFQMLVNELNHQHSSKLEWTIIWLIVIEVVLSLTKEVIAFF